MKPPTNPTNKQVTGGFNRKETWVLPWILKKCEAPVYEIAFKILKSDLEAEYVTNEIFQKLFFVQEHKKSFKEIRDLLYNAGKNLALDRLKKNQSEQKYILEKANIQSLVVDAGMERNETAAALYYEISRCKNKLSPQPQRVFDLYFIHQMSIPEIAREMKISEQSVSNYKTTALRVMRLEIIPRKSFLFLLTILS
jgi:RNA polymerase sigma factor (sigma-70 family)